MLYDCGHEFQDVPELDGMFGRTTECPACYVGHQIAAKRRSILDQLEDAHRTGNPRAVQQAEDDARDFSTDCDRRRADRQKESQAIIDLIVAKDFLRDCAARYA